MSSLAEHIADVPTRTLAPGEVLLTEGESSGEIHVLLTGALEVVRGGVALVTLDSPGTLVGEMSVLLGRPATATVRAAREARVRTIGDAANVLESDAQLVFRIASLLAARLDATSSLLVDLNRENAGKSHEQGLLRRILTALTRSDELTEVERTDLFSVDPAIWPRGPI